MIHQTRLGFARNKAPESAAKNRILLLVIATSNMIHNITAVAEE